MDLRHYYAEVAATEETIEGEDALIVSRPTDLPPGTEHYSGR